MKKILIVRFSSFGDIAQALPSSQLLREEWSDAEVHWLTRSDFHDFVKCCTAVDQVWSLDRKTGLPGLIQIIRRLHQEKFTHLYDAHNNLRSWLIKISLKVLSPSLVILTRSKNRLKRFLLFKLRKNYFETPFRGAVSFLTPLNKWLNRTSWPKHFQFQTQDIPVPMKSSGYILLAPSATWDLKKWPTEYWQNLIRIMPQSKFIILGGNADHFCEDIAQVDKTRVINLAGKLNWAQSTKIISEADIIISGDTGVLHVADILKRKTIAIIGPTAFGFPSNETSKIAEVTLSCRPCTKDGRGECHNPEYQKCLRDITPQNIVQLLEEFKST